MLGPTHQMGGLCEMCVYEMVKMGDVKCMRGMCVCYGGKVCVCVSLREREMESWGKRGEKFSCLLAFRRLQRRSSHRRRRHRCRRGAQL